MPSLRELQQRFADAVLAADGTPLANTLHRFIGDGTITGLDVR